MSEAHQTLIDGEKRARYMTLLRDGGATPESQAEIVRVVEAATDFQKAEICLKRNDIVQAESFCKKAVEADPVQADYHALLAWLEALKPSHQDAQSTEAAISKLGKALGMNPKCERAYFYRGMLYKRLKQEAAAVKDFRRSFELNPKNIDAQREVRLSEMRKGTPSTPAGARKKHDEEKGGLFGKLFKK
jgi:Tfp pilus assembly protein PilF